MQCSGEFRILENRPLLKISNAVFPYYLSTWLLSMNLRNCQLIIFRTFQGGRLPEAYPRGKIAKIAKIRLRLIARQPWRHCVTSLRSAHWLASSLKLAARCPVSGCWPSCSNYCWQIIVFLSDGVEGDAIHVSKDVVIGVAVGLIMVALCVVAGVAFRSFYFARRQRFHNRHAQGASHVITFLRYDTTR